MGDDRLGDVIEALSAHPQLEELHLVGMNVGRNECTNLANVLHGMSELTLLKLYSNDIDDEGVDAFVGAPNNSRLRILDVAMKKMTTMRDRRAPAPEVNLEEVYKLRAERRFLCLSCPIDFSANKKNTSDFIATKLVADRKRVPGS
jgi:hypothetical protein